jgi:transposase
MTNLDIAPVRFLGFDVAKDTVTFVDTLTQTPRTIANSHRAIRSVLGLCGPDCLVICEPTGGHETPLLEECLRAGVPCHRADTLKVKAFIRSFGTLGKTDAIDAARLASYGRERWQALPLWSLPDADETRLQALVRRRRDLTDMKVAEQNRAKAAGAAQLAASFRAMLHAINSQIEAANKLIDALIAQNRRLAQRLAVCTAMTGIGRHTGACLIGLMPELGSLSRRTAAALAGVAPHPNDSGKLAGYRRMRGGRPEIPTVLFMPALHAARGKGEFAAFYQRLIDNGKKPIVAIAAVMRKIIITLNARLRDANIQQS